MIRLRTLGALAVLDGSRPLGGNLQQPRRLALLAVLARAGEEGISRDRLAGLLWEDVEEERSRKSLNQALYALRQDLGSEEAILGTRDLRLNPEWIEVDVAGFETARASGSLEEAARLYAGPFLGDFHLPGVSGFGRWAEEEREKLQEEYRGILEAVAAAAFRRDDPSGAITWYRRLAALDPGDPSAALGLMRALAAAGDVPGALRHAEIFNQLRLSEFELPPDPQVLALAERIREGDLVTARAPATERLPEREAQLGASESLKAAPVKPALPRSRVRLHWLAITALIALLAIVLWPTPKPAPGPKRLAVLPFDNLGDSAEAYFADGMTDELRGRLTTIRGLEVLASLSSNDYRGTTKRLREIASDLGVSYLLIGRISWQNTGGVSRVRVIPELIQIVPGRAPTTRWQEAFDAPLTDMFQVQADIATRVAAELDIVLGDSARRELISKPTENMAAYDEYLKGEAAAQSMKGDQASLRRAVAYYQRAVALDSAFAAAWSQLSRALTSLYSNGVPDPALGRQAQAAAERARQLKPGDPFTWLALGDYYGSVNPVDNEKAMAAFEQGLRIAPDNVDLLGAAVSTETSLGRWEGVTDRLDRAVRLDPRSANAARRQSTVNLFLRKYPAADSAADRAIALAPTSPAIVQLKVLAALAQGNLPAARTAINRAAALIEPNALLAYFAYYQDLYWVLEDQQQLQVLELPPSAFDDDRGGWTMVRTALYQLRGDRQRSLIYADSARMALEEQARTSPEDGQRRVLLGLALAYLGRKEAAIREGERGLALMPISRDGYFGPYVQLQLARIYILVGEPDKAMDQLERLLSVPFYLSPGWLRIDPTFDPLRKNPRFIKLSENTG